MFFHLFFQFLVGSELKKSCPAAKRPGSLERSSQNYHLLIQAIAHHFFVPQQRLAQRLEKSNRARLRHLEGQAEEKDEALP
jgi:hypothetical protein